jgi:Uma2 family endonuclease
MADGGVFTEDDRVELLEGEVVEMAPIGSRHAGCVNRLNMFFAKRLEGHTIAAVQNPVLLSEHSEPQPDFALLRPRPDAYAGSHPGPEDVVLLVEVADTTAAWDRRHKLPLYAAAGVPEVWLIDLTAEVVEVCRRPEGAAYREVRVALPAEHIAPEAFPEVSLPVRDLLA